MRSFLYKMPGAEPESTWTPDDWAAVNEHSRQTGAAVMRVVLLISATVNVLLWYLEWSGQAIRVPAALHIGLLALTLGVLYGPGAELLRRWPTAVGLLVLVPTVAALGAWLGADAGPRSFAWLYLLGTTTVVFVVRIVPRIGITALLMGVAVLGYVLAAGPDVWQSPQLPTQLSFLAFVIVISTGNGHYTFWVSSGAALQRVRMAERQGELAKLHAQLEGRVSGQKAELGALAEHLRQVRDRERLTLRREIRAELAPELEGLRRCVESLEREPTTNQAAALLAQTEGGMERAHEVFRRILNRLHPMVLEQLGLPAALRWLAEDAEKRCGIPVELQVDLGTRTRSEEEDRLVFLTVRDGLRRSEAAGPPTEWEVQVKPHASGGALVVEVIDDIGDDWDPNTAGVLFVGVREQVLASGGAVSAAGDGQRGLLRAVIPSKDDS